MILEQKDANDVCKLLKKQQIVEYKQIQLTDEKMFIKILLDTAQNEAVLDVLLKKKYIDQNNRAIILPVESILPRSEVKESSIFGKQTMQIGREELYENIKNQSQSSRSYLIMIILSSILACIGFQTNSIAIIIGSMVIAPMLGPSVAFGLGATLGDLSLLRHALVTSLIGIAGTIVSSIVIGFFVHLDPTLSEIALRTQVKLSDITVALVTGCAGALAFTSGKQSTLVGVMVAIALLPPLVAFGLLLGGRHPWPLIGGALGLFSVNFVGMNLAIITTFVLQGIHPLSWWRKDRAKKATRIAVGLGILKLVIFIVLILLLRKGAL